MAELEYKNMTEQELDTILHQLCDECGTILERIARFSEGERYTSMTSDYTNLKSKLRSMHHYTSLVRNEKPSNEHYNFFFRPAVQEAYVHCSAKANGIDVDMLRNTLYEVQSDIEYYFKSNDSKH